MKNRKKQILFLAGIAVVLVIAVVILFIYGKEETPSTTYHESERQDTVEYDDKEYRYNEHLSNFLFLGIDTREPVEEYETMGEAGQADSIFLLSLNRVEGTVKIFAIPRDTMTNIRVIAPGGEDLGKNENHINIQYAFGDGKWKSCELMKEAVSQLFYGVPIQGYCSMNMDGISVATDIMGGVQLTISNDLFTEIDPDYQKGSVVTVTGENAERIVRYRNTEKGNSALERMERQMILLDAFAKEAKALASSDESFITEMLDGVQDYMVTNIGNDMFAKMLEASYSGEEIQVIPGEGVVGGEYDEYHVDDEQMYELVLEMFYVEVQGE